MTEDNFIAKELSSQFQKRILQDKLTEQDEKFIYDTFDHDYFVTVSNHGLEAEYMGNRDIAFGCLRFAAIGGIVADQEQLAEHYFRKKNYKNAARWYIRSALNNHSDALALLYRIDEEKEIMKYVVDPANESYAPSKAMDILEEYWKNQDTDE